MNADRVQTTFSCWDCWALILKGRIILDQGPWTWAIQTTATSLPPGTFLIENKPEAHKITTVRTVTEWTDNTLREGDEPWQGETQYPGVGDSLVEKLLTRPTLAVGCHSESKLWRGGAVKLNFPREREAVPPRTVRSRTHSARGSFRCWPSIWERRQHWHWHSQPRPAPRLAWLR